MKRPITEAIETILAADDAQRYLAAQDAALEHAREQYAQLCELARHDQRVAVRWEALQLISLLQSPDHRQVLEAALKEDSDSDVRDCAKALVFRSVVSENVRKSGKLTDAAMLAYEMDVRSQAAQGLFGHPTVPDEQ